MDFPRLVDFNPTLDTSAYANNDVLFDAQLITGLCFDKDRPAILDHAVLIDKDDQGVAIDLYFFSSLVVFGTANGAVSISDADSLAACGKISFATGDYTDLGGTRVAIKSNLGLIVKPVAASADVYVAGILGVSTPTFTASGIRFRFGMRRF